MKTIAKINYNKKDQRYSVSSYEFDNSEIAIVGDGETAIEAVEDFVSYIVDYISDFASPDEMVGLSPDFKSLFGLKLQIEANCSLTSEERLYVKAMNIMLRQHYGQKDKAGHDYYFRPVRVSVECYGTDEKIVALLHDAIEDTGLTVDELRKAGFSEDIIKAILSVTRQKNETYAKFIERVKQNNLSISVKLRDLEDNMDITRLTDLTNKDFRRLNKYLHSWRYLVGLEKDSSMINDK